MRNLLRYIKARKKIGGIAAVDSSTLAAATIGKIVLMDMDGTVYKTLKGEIKVFFVFLQTSPGELPCGSVPLRSSSEKEVFR